MKIRAMYTSSWEKDPTPTPVTILTFIECVGGNDADLSSKTFAVIAFRDGTLGHAEFSELKVVDELG